MRCVEAITFADEKEVTPAEYGVLSLNKSAANGDGVASELSWFIGDAHGGRAFIYDLATSIGVPGSPSVAWIKKITQITFLKENYLILIIKKIRFFMSHQINSFETE